ncbi:MnhB domain-containing protein [Halomicrobium salinisoli]|uniref:MnhB domain-containing protein n=1 Tax=Halomicrobium salinisoli TaxID=2878391 RepID=UPI001CEFCD92|nr:MnhB domain-containing protein [Halomicrobium salinisoli]
MSDDRRGDAGDRGAHGRAGDGQSPEGDDGPVGPIGDGRTAEADDRVGSVRRQQTPYTESQVIMTTVKMVSPFVFSYGLFVTFHGGGSPGGGFQGGAIAAAVVLMVAFAFGIDATREWVSNNVLTALATGGVVVFAGIGLVGLARGGTFLEYQLLPIPHPVKYGMEGIEIGGIALIVGSVLVGLFFLLAAGYADEEAAVADGGADDNEVRDT